MYVCILGIHCLELVICLFFYVYTLEISVCVLVLGTNVVQYLWFLVCIYIRRIVHSYQMQSEDQVAV